MKEQALKNRTAYGAYNAAAIVMNPKNGEVLSMVGSADPWADSLPKDVTQPKPVNLFQAIMWLFKD